MLRDVLGNFLESVSEREFDAPFLAILATNKFTNVHFIHGAFEFGKDFIAQRPNAETGAIEQYVIQAKAGDLGQTEWRSVRPQLEEAAYNNLAHADFDPNLPRVVVLATTGRLKGSAPVDAQQFRDHLASTLRMRMEIWEEEQFLGWLSADPTLGASGGESPDLLRTVVMIERDEVEERELERQTRRWTGDRSHFGATALEAAVIANLFRHKDQLDMAALVTLHALRGVWAKIIEFEPVPDLPPIARSLTRMYASFINELLDDVEPYLSDPSALLRAACRGVPMVTYSALVCRMAELFGIAALMDEEDLGIAGLNVRAHCAVIHLITGHPGAVRPVSDDFAVSLIAPAIVAFREDRSLARSYLREVALWMIDRHNPEQSGLGLASMDESAEVVVERLLGGALESTSLVRRTSSVVATVLLDLIARLEDPDLYCAVLLNLRALEIVPTIASADERTAKWHRGGPNVQPHPFVEFAEGSDPSETLARYVRPEIPARYAIMLAVVVRSRYDTNAITAAIKSGPSADLGQQHGSKQME